MEIATSDMISKIDCFAEQELSLSTVTLMDRAGLAVKNLIFKEYSDAKRIIILAGSGNNGGDGYSCAVKLINEFEVLVFDVFGKGQKSFAGKNFLTDFQLAGGKIITGLPSDEVLNSADVIVDAIFGTGFTGEVPENIAELSYKINAIERIKKVAIDIPVGVSADDGCIKPCALKCDFTVCLSFLKPAAVLYPSKEFMGKVILDDLGINISSVIEKFNFENHYFDRNSAKEALPQRYENSNKGSFGKAMLIVGSREYIGAASLSLEASLRGGAGYVHFVGEEELCKELRFKFPEALYSNVSYKTIEGINEIVRISKDKNSILLGCGSGKSKELYYLISELLKSDGSPVILDADAINSIAEFGDKEILKDTKRTVIITPHPAEFARLTGNSTVEIQSNRYFYSKSFAFEYNCVVVLKGAGTIVTDGITTYVNSSGSSALAKAGSGDVLGGLIASFLAFSDNPLLSVALAVYLHGAGGDLLAERYSSFGVTPSDIPKVIATVMSEIERERK